MLTVVGFAIAGIWLFNKVVRKLAPVVRYGSALVIALVVGYAVRRFADRKVR